MKNQRPNADAVVVCPVGLETLCEAELKALGYRTGGPTAGLVPFRGSTRSVYEANLWLRTATRVLVRVARFKATDFAHLERRISEVDLGQYLGQGVAPRFRVTCRKSALFHSDAVSERLHSVVGPAKSSDDHPEQTFIVRIDHDTVTVSVDASGEPLHKRSWRTETVSASLRPSLAAATILASGWDRETPVIDPFSGSGTFIIEAGLIAAGLPPSVGREYAFHRWPSFEGGTWASVTGAAKQRTRDLAVENAPLLEGCDRDASAVAATTANAERAGIDVKVHMRPVGQMTGHRGSGLIVSNPPYGKRSSTGGKGTSAVYRRFGEVSRDRRPESSLAVVVPSDAGTIDRRLKDRIKTSNGGIDVRIATMTPEPAVEPDPQA